MQTAYYGLAGLVLLIHLYIVVLEMVLWERRAPAVFGLKPELARQTKAMASNQGLYNFFLVLALGAGLGLEAYAGTLTDPLEVFLSGSGFTMAGLALQGYALLCVVLAGCWGAATVSRRILWVQALPAALALALLCLRVWAFYEA